MRKVWLIVGLDLRQARFYLKFPSSRSKLIFQGFGFVITAAGSFVMSLSRLKVFMQAYANSFVLKGIPSQIFCDQK